MRISDWSSDVCSSDLAATAPGTPVTYACTDASPVSVAWGHDQARVEFADGRKISLPKAQSAYKCGGDVFVGETVSLQRDGDDIQLFEGQGTARQCSAQAAQIGRAQVCTPVTNAHHV